MLSSPGSAWERTVGQAPPGSACRIWKNGRDWKSCEAEPRQQRVPRRSLGTRLIDSTVRCSADCLPESRAVRDSYNRDTLPRQSADRRRRPLPARRWRSDPGRAHVDDACDRSIRGPRACREDRTSYSRRRHNRSHTRPRRRMRRRKLLSRSRRRGTNPNDDTTYGRDSSIRCW